MFKSQVLQSPCGDSVEVHYDGVYWKAETPLALARYDFGGKIRACHMNKAKPTFDDFYDALGDLMSDYDCNEDRLAEDESTTIPEALDDMSIRNSDWVAEFDKEYVKLCCDAIEELVVKPINENKMKPNAFHVNIDRYSENNPYVVSVVWFVWAGEFDSGEDSKLEEFWQHCLKLSEPYLTAIQLEELDVTPVDMNEVCYEELESLARDYVFEPYDDSDDLYERWVDSQYDY